MLEKVFSAASMPVCQICGKEALFQCSECQKTFYCSRDHQFEHWKKGHKAECQSNKPQFDELQKKILEVRKSYYENFSHKQYSECLLDAKVLVGLEKKRLSAVSNINNQLDYGGTVCLLTKTYLLLNDKKGAKQQLQAYLLQSKQFLENLSDIPSIKQKEVVKEKYHQYLQKKLNLISCVGNLCYAIGLDCISYYVLYTKIIMIFFGPDSYEASNCYFLIGCYYAEQGYFKKAIQCFKKAANIRGQFAGDCFYNIGILYKMQGDLPRALEILQKSLKLRQQQYGQDSNKVAEINEMMGIIYTQLNDFKTAMVEYEKAFNLRSTSSEQKQCQEFVNVLDLIHQLYDKLTLFIQAGQPKVKKPEIYTHLKMSIQNEKKYWQIPKYKKKLQEYNENERQNKKVETTQKKDEEKDKINLKKKFQYNLVLTEQFTSKLNLAELYRLSELQLELQKCTTQFGVIYTIGTSPFYQNLTPQNYYELEKQNRQLFELIKLEQLNKMKNNEK